MNDPILSRHVSLEENTWPDASAPPTTLPAWPPGVLARSGENSFGIACGMSTTTDPIEEIIWPMNRAENRPASTGPSGRERGVGSTPK